MKIVDKLAKELEEAKKISSMFNLLKMSKAARAQNQVVDNQQFIFNAQNNKDT